MSVDGTALAARFRTAFAALPLVAILRGIRPDEAEPVGAVLDALDLINARIDAVEGKLK